MRKLYALLAGIFCTLLATTSYAVPSTPDVANFTFRVDHAGKNVVFRNTSTIGSEPGVRRAYWSFGDGTGVMTPPLQGIRHHYQHPGTYTVCLKIYRYRSNTGDSVLSAQICKTVVINTVCRADFEKLPSPVANPLRASFRALPWHNDNKRPVEICWSFGDGTDTCIQYSNTNPGPYLVHHTYTSPGIYEVCVRIVYSDGCEARKCKQIRIGRPPETCRSNFEKLPVSTVNNPLLVYYKALPWHSNNKKPQRICWSFGDGTDTCINYPAGYTGLYIVRHRYNYPGLYEVCVRIQYYGGCEARKCNNIQVGRPDTCRANFERLPVSVNNNPLDVAFRALPWHNNNRKPARICWRFGDGTDTCINYAETYNGIYGVRHRYNQPGRYEVCVRILYYGGCEARKCNEVIIGRPDSCRADFERMPPVAATPLTVGLKALPWHNNNKKPKMICWSFGDGTDTCINYPENYNGLYNIVHHYQQPGQYEICVVIEYYGGCEARKCKQATIPPPPVICSVQLVEISPSQNSLQRSFLAIPQSAPPRRPVRICWFFGDGEDTCIIIQPGQPWNNFSIRHTYPGPGTYRACVKVLYEGGCLAEDCKQIVIRSSSNVCGGFVLDSLIAPRTFKFKGFSIHAQNDEVTGYRWTFGDGTSATGREVTHTYQQPGRYEVCMYIKTRLECETRVCQPVRVPGHHQPVVNLSPNPVVNTLRVAFTSTQTEQVTITIISNSGAQVRSFARNVVEGPNNWDIDLGSLVPGMYSLLVQSPGQLANAVFIKQ